MTGFNFENWWNSECVLDDCSRRALAERAYVMGHKIGTAAATSEILSLNHPAGQALGNLLARMLGDGGHRYIEVGLKQACEEAEAKWNKIRDVEVNRPKQPSHEKIKAYIQYVSGLEQYAYIHGALAKEPKPELLEVGAYLNAIAKGEVK